VLCRDRHFNEEVVVKALHAADLERDPEDVFHEASTLRGLSHPAIIGVRDSEYADPAARARPYLVMDYFPGRTLEDHVRAHGPLGVADLLQVATQVARGMQAAHARGVLHRDLKPANVLIRQQGGRWQVNVIDFGLALRRQTIEASLAQAPAGETTRGRSVAGTVMYAPPEQMGRLPGTQPGPYSDVYAYGKTCCYALFMTTEPRSRHWATLPEGLAEMLERCTEQDLEHRHTEFGPVLAALDPAEEQEQPRQRGGEERLRRDEEECDRLLSSGKVSVAFLDRLAPGRIGAWPEAAPRGLPAAPGLLGLA
jgi:serine/threonine protein kinase